MTELNWVGEFREIMIGLAAQDVRTKRVIDWVLRDELEREVVEPAELTVAIAEYYALEPEAMIKVFKLHEDRMADAHDQT